jgi:hypothetical protein
MIAACRKELLTVLSRLDQLATDADTILAGPGHAEIYAMAEELRERLVDVRAKVEEKLQRLAL